jgi:dTDP-4-dehydrorhamnose 3,5-epimerase
MNHPTHSHLTESMINGVKLLTHKPHLDSRGIFREVIRSSELEKEILQTNYSISHKGVIRGLHIQNEKPQGKFITVVSGKIFDVFLDCRIDSPTFGEWDAVHLDGESGMGIFLPAGIAHGFCSLSPVSCVLYSCTDNFYIPELDGGIRYDDPYLGIEWPESNPIVSVKDKALPMWSEYAKNLR